MYKLLRDSVSLLFVIDNVTIAPRKSVRPTRRYTMNEYPEGAVWNFEFYSNEKEIEKVKRLSVFRTHTYTYMYRGYDLTNDRYSEAGEIENVA